MTRREMSDKKPFQWKEFVTVSLQQNLELRSQINISWIQNLSVFFRASELGVCGWERSDAPHQDTMVHIFLSSSGQYNMKWGDLCERLELGGLGRSHHFSESVGSKNCLARNRWMNLSWFHRSRFLSRNVLTGSSAFWGRAAEACMVVAQVVRLSRAPIGSSSGVCEN